MAAVPIVFVAAMFLILISVLQHRGRALEELEDYLWQGFLFAMKIFSTVIPIAGFFFLGSPENAKMILGENAPGFLDCRWWVRCRRHWQCPWEAMELARKNFIPVVSGLVVATIVGIFMM